MTGDTRAAATAGVFYPRNAEELAATVDALLAAADPWDGDVPHAIVVPHAGYAYSGAVAAAAYRSIAVRAGEIRRVVLFGPPHHVPVAGAAVPASGAWATPLGTVPVADDLRRVAIAAGATVEDIPHAPEHSLEVQLPFLQRVLEPRFSILPVLVGDLPAGPAADLIAALWGGPETLVVVSTDLSHYLVDPAARAVDRHTADAVVGLRPDAITAAGACGSRALRGLVEHARRNGHAIVLLALGTSADAGGDSSRVVGYGAFAVA